MDIPSGKHTINYGKIDHFQWVNSRFLWPFSIAMLNYQMVFIYIYTYWLVVLTIFEKYESQWEGLSHIIIYYGKQKMLDTNQYMHIMRI